MYLGQRARAKDASVKEGVHTVLVGIQSYAADNEDTSRTRPLAASRPRSLAGPSVAAEPLRQSCGKHD